MDDKFFANMIKTLSKECVYYEGANTNDLALMLEVHTNATEKESPKTSPNNYTSNNSSDFKQNQIIIPFGLRHFKITTETILELIDSKTNAVITELKFNEKIQKAVYASFPSQPIFLAVLTEKLIYFFDVKKLAKKYFFPLPFSVKSIWPLPQGIIIELNNKIAEKQTDLNSLLSPNKLNKRHPLQYMCHPLEKTKKILIKDNNNRLDKDNKNINPQSERIIYTDLNHPIIITFDLQNKVHHFYLFHLSEFSKISAHKNKNSDKEEMKGVTKKIKLEGEMKFRNCNGGEEGFYKTERIYSCSFVRTENNGSVYLVSNENSEALLCLFLKEKEILLTYKLTNNYKQVLFLNAARCIDCKPIPSLTIFVNNRNDKNKVLQPNPENILILFHSGNIGFHYCDMFYVSFGTHYGANKILSTSESKIVLELETGGEKQLEINNFDALKSKLIKLCFCSIDSLFYSRDIERMAIKFISFVSKRDSALKNSKNNTEYFYLFKNFIFNMFRKKKAFYYENFDFLDDKNYKTENGILISLHLLCEAFKLKKIYRDNFLDKMVNFMTELSVFFKNKGYISYYKGALISPGNNGNGSNNSEETKKGNNRSNEFHKNKVFSLFELVGDSRDNKKVNLAILTYSFKKKRGGEKELPPPLELLRKVCLFLEFVSLSKDEKCRKKDAGLSALLIKEKFSVSDFEDLPGKIRCVLKTELSAEFEIFKNAKGFNITPDYIGILRMIGREDVYNNTIIQLKKFKRKNLAIKTKTTERFPNDLRLEEVNRCLGASKEFIVIPEMEDYEKIISPNVSDHFSALFLRHFRRGCHAALGRAAFLFGTVNSKRDKTIGKTKKLKDNSKEETKGDKESDTKKAFSQTKNKRNDNLTETQTLCDKMRFKGFENSFSLCEDSKEMARERRLGQLHSEAAFALSLDLPSLSREKALYIDREQQKNAYSQAGFLIGAGLRGRLRNLPSAELYRYFQNQKEIVSVALIMAFCRDSMGSCDNEISKMVSLYMPDFMVGNLATNEKSISSEQQMAALIGMGFLFFSSGDKDVLQTFSGVIEKSIGEAFGVDLGRLFFPSAVAIGLVTFGEGRESKGLSKELETKLLRYAFGGRRLKTNKISETSIEPMEGSNLCYPGKEYDLLVTSPGAFISLGMAFFNTNDKKILDLISMPNSEVFLGNYRPELFFYRTFSKCLVSWEHIEPSKQWFWEQIPKYLCDADPSLVNNCHNKKRTNKMFYSKRKQLIYSVLGCSFALALKYVGTHDKNAFQVLFDFLVLYRKELKGFSSKNYGENGEKYCLKVFSISQIMNVALVMAGSGDLKTFKLLRSLRKICNKLSSNETETVSLAMGLLFLKRGTASLIPSSSKESLASLIVSTLPALISKSLILFNSYPFLFRYLWARSVENRLFATMEVGTKQFVSIKVALFLCLKRGPKGYQNDIEKDTKNGEKEKQKEETGLVKEIFNTPLLLPDFSIIERIEVVDKGYYWQKVEGKDVRLFVEKGVFYVQRRET